VAELEKQGVIDVFFGGIALKAGSGISGQYQIERELTERTDEKRRIARMAVSLIEPNDVILIDTGSTTELMLDYFSDDMKHIVYCYALNIINKVSRKRNLRLVACGGYFHSNISMFESEEGANQIRKASINKVFLAARGVSEEMGVTSAEPFELVMKKAALQAGKKKILLADSSKFGKAWYAQYATLEDFDAIVTDSALNEEYRQLVKDRGITLYTV
jgi:DeoR family deoxyribose operon repressor